MVFSLVMLGERKKVTESRKRSAQAECHIVSWNVSYILLHDLPLFGIRQFCAQLAIAILLQQHNNQAFLPQ